MENEVFEYSQKYNNSEKAIRYPSEFRKFNFRDIMEKRCLQKAVMYIQKDAKILDVPCGSGRLTEMLLEKSSSLTSADVSDEMISLAAGKGNMNGKLTFLKSDLVRGTQFSDGEFDAVVCHRFFHHLPEKNFRVKVIRELARITSELIIFSFYNSNSLSARMRLFSNSLKGKKQKDRVPLSPDTLLNEFKDAGIEIAALFHSIKYISPMCVAVGRKVKNI